jgi:hypothetical protein
MVCFAVSDPERRAEALRAQGIDVDTRPGTGVRMSCHPCITVEECDRAVEALARPA